MEDYDGAIALWSGVEGVEICEGDSREEIAEYLKRNPGLSRVAEAEGKIVGAALCGHDGRRGWIYHLAVAKSHQRQKVGRLLLEACVAGLRDAGLKRAIILVAGDNPARMTKLPRWVTFRYSSFMITSPAASGFGWDRAVSAAARSPWSSCLSGFPQWRG
jgi:ribosomal protein S18 acetylase RimI-like enzyme